LAACLQYPPKKIETSSNNLFWYLITKKKN